MNIGPFITDEEIEIAREGLVRGGAIASPEAWKQKHGTDWMARSGAWCFDARGRRCFGDIEVGRAAAEKTFPLAFYFCPATPEGAVDLVTAKVIEVARRVGLVDKAAGDASVDVALLLEELERRASSRKSKRKSRVLVDALADGTRALGLRPNRDPAAMLAAIVAIARLSLHPAAP